MVLDTEIHAPIWCKKKLNAYIREESAKMDNTRFNS